MYNTLKRSFLLLLLFLSGFVMAQSPATVREYKKVFTTYPFSDPDPIPSQAAIYPYFRFDGFTNSPVQKEWKVVELENDFIRVMILPEVGGKIWTAIEKRSGQPFIYYNQVVKFRDVAMRGPWTSGGLEPNYGIIGHTPNCATPADYLVRVNDDKSVSCFIGVLDLLTRTRWQLEVNLPHDRAYFTTRSFWNNPTALEQPYYHWMNMGIKVKGNLEFIYPGTHYIGHEGEYAEWPVNRDNGKAINFYEQNDFGSYKSYHVFGKYTDFFGAYWHDDQLGMVRYAPQDEKAGKKIWIWGLSRQGMIWEKILTDTDGQYAEIQSGRLFNQSAELSTFTPFKHRSFAPQATDRWTEYWYPVRNTRGIKAANNAASINLVRENGWIKWYCSPVQALQDSVWITVDGQSVYRRALTAAPLQVVADSIRDQALYTNLRIEIPGIHLAWESDPGFQNLSRPLETPKDFDWNSAYGLYLQGKELMDQKLFTAAEDKLVQSLERNPVFLPALVKYAEWLYRSGQYKEAFIQARKALAVDTHDGSANYYYGIAAASLGDWVNARDGLGIASLSPEYRSAAYTELARIHCIEKNWNAAVGYADKALDFNRYDVVALEIKAIAYRYLGQTADAATVLARLEADQPLSPFVKMERSIGGVGPALGADAFDRNELPQEVWMELASAYAGRGLREEALKCLTLAGNQPLPLYWRAYLAMQAGQPYQALLASAHQLSPLGVFPFRAEMLPVLAWVVSVSDNWKPRYYLALLLNDKNQKTEARRILQLLGDTPDFAPFYALRALWFASDSALVVRSLGKAMTLDVREWRYPKLLAQHYIRERNYTAARAVVEAFVRTHPGHFIMEMLYAKALLLNREYAACDALLASMDIIPFEGATDGRLLYWEAKLMQALQQMEKKQYAKALKFVEAAAQWPENLGVGKPYDTDLDSRLEDWMRYLVYQRTGKEKEAAASLKRIMEFKPGVYNTVRNFQPANHLVTAWAMAAAGKRDAVIGWLDQQIAQFPSLPQIRWAKETFLQPGKVKGEGEDAGIRVLEGVGQYQSVDSR